MERVWTARRIVTTGHVCTFVLAVLNKVQAATGLYRFLTKHGGYVYMETSAALSGDENSERRDRYVICVNYAVRFVIILHYSNGLNSHKSAKSCPVD